MRADQQINCYCFSQACAQSIFHSFGCVVVKRSFADAAEKEQKCTSCGQLLVSVSMIRASRMVDQLLVPKTLKSFVIDDDSHFQSVSKDLFAHSRRFSESHHLTSAQQALDYLFRHRQDPDQIPDYIFLDVHMPEMDAWDFLEEFDHLSLILEKQVSIYVISTHIEQDFKERVKRHTNVKDVIDKSFGLEFLDNIQP